MKDWLWSQILPENMDAFRWIPGETPFSHWSVLPISWAGYWAVILGLKAFMKNREPMKLKLVSALHNLIICLWSLVMFIGTVIAMLERSESLGSRSLFCSTDPEQNKGKLHYWLFIYHISKWYELLDTVIRLLNKKDIIFLHWYHHSIVMAMTWAWLEYDMVFGGWGMLANTFVHVIMYLYYFLCSIKVRVPNVFKKSITTIQIIQFAISFVLGVIYKFYALTGPCIGADNYAFEFSLLCNLSFFILFNNFFTKNYSGAKGGEKND